MRLPVSQRFSRLPSEDPREEQDIILPAYPSQTRMDTKSAFETKVHGAADTGYAAGEWNTAAYTVSHRQTLVEHLEQREHHHFGTATIMRGSCNGVRNANTGIHAALNVLSTMVLGASTYAMQDLTAPSRLEVDAAHAKGKWVEIGTSSVRNLFHVRRRNVWIWGLLAMTSLPFHLVFNAVFFTTSQANQYAVAVIDESYFANTNFRPAKENASPELFGPSSYANNDCDGAPCAFDIRDVSRVVALLRDVRRVSRNANFSRMEAQECMRNYSSGFIQGYSDVVVILNEPATDSPLLWTRYPQRSVDHDTEHTNPDPFRWVCHDAMMKNDTNTHRCSLKTAMEKFDSGKNWTVQGHPVSHCFARTISETCQLQFNGYLMIAVVVFGVIKVLTIGYLVLARSAGRHLRTIGDAIASFLEEEDPTTKGMCLVTSQQIRKDGFRASYRYGPQIYTGMRPRWLTGANTTEFFTTICVSAFYILVLSIALFFAIDGAKGLAFSNGLGQPGIQSLASFKRDDTGSSGIVPTLLIANIPQLGFSILYVVYTNIWNKLVVAQEFNTLTAAKKGLRVSDRPRGMQRASRFFSLPVRYALPLMACSAALHWLCSQSFFMVRIDGVDAQAHIDEHDQLVRLGYSATGVIALIGVSVGMMVATVCTTFFRRLRTPLGETSMSVIISAACHIRRYEPEPWLREVQWGDTTAVDEGGVRHCAFTTGMVDRPIVGQAYQ
ncbi:hypothetical protein BDW02DRAFT_569698 [Decorospora gaudefroyi]|uniref:DUF6536 domain-containing protein n=1 Tax=Decorospora gaudefroyi TaxID=184978 RepID=A0A6A5KE68_9PLEO|nr:hypothetical protein BDW02DRAFT_569698 [Decorospora gaudefroyi]